MVNLIPLWKAGSGCRNFCNWNQRSALQALKWRTRGDVTWFGWWQWFIGQKRGRNDCH